jgi:PBP1b-binding outer membrane lipoprotein LpoB
MSRNYLVIAIWALFITGCQSKKTLNESPKDSVRPTLAVDDESVIIEEQ